MVFCEGTDQIIHTIYEFAGAKCTLEAVAMRISTFITSEVEIFICDRTQDNVAYGCDWEHAAVDGCWFSDCIKPNTTDTCSDALLVFRTLNRVDAANVKLSVVRAERDDVEGGFRFNSLESDQDRELIQTVLPHLFRAARIHQQSVELRSDLCLLVGALEAIPAPVILVSKGLRVLGMNTQAQNFLNKSGELRVRRGRLKTQGPNKLFALQSAVNSAIEDGLTPFAQDINTGLAEDSGYSVSISQGARDVEVLAVPVRQVAEGEYGALLVLNPQFSKATPPLQYSKPLTS